MTGLRDRILADLPPYQGIEVMVRKKQSLKDIIREVLEAHEAFAPDYDQAATYFSEPGLFRQLFNFCKSNIRYEIEGEEMQTTMSPAAMLALGRGDCKHYSSFIAGILDALNRAGIGSYDWVYRFAGYNGNGVEHVFVVVTDEQGKEIWIDPAPISGIGGYTYRSFDDRLSEPTSYFDRKPSVMALKRISGIADSGGISTVTVIRRKDLAAASGNGCNCGAIGLREFPALTSKTEVTYLDGGEAITEPYYMGPVYADVPADTTPIETVPAVVPSVPEIQTAILENAIPAPTASQFGAIDFLLDPFITVSKGYITKTEAASYLVNGVPLIFPAPTYGKMPPPQNLQVVYPETYRGKAVPAGMPRPIAVGNRIILLPKRDWALLKADNFFWLGFLTSVMAPLVASYAVKPAGNDGFLKAPRHGNAGASDSNLSHAILYDMDKMDVVDYVTNMPTKIPVTADIPEGVTYVMDNGQPLPFSDARTKMKGQVDILWFHENKPPVLPAFQCNYPASYLGQPLPASLPRPVYVNGKVQALPKGLDWNILKENNFFWLTFITSVFAPIIDTYSQFPYSDDENKLAERLLYDMDTADIIGDYLVPPITKTWAGEIIDSIEEIVQDVGTFLLKFVGAIPRTAFLLLVRYNVKGMATSLADNLVDLVEREKLINKWKSFGGTQGDLVDAIEDGAKKSSIGGEQIGMTGAEIAAAIAAASPVIALLAEWLKKRNPELAAVIDKAIGEVNNLLEDAGYDPIGLGSATNTPVTVIDPVTGQPYTIPPPPSKVDKNGFFQQVGKFVQANPVTATVIGAALVWGGIEVVKAMRKRKRA